VLEVVPNRHRWLLDPYSAKHPDVVCLTQRGPVSLLRVNTAPAPAVQTLLGRLPTDVAITPDELTARCELPFHRYSAEPWFFVSPDTFVPYSGHEVRMLGEGDASAVEWLHQGVDARHRWYVELEHSAAFGCFHEGKLVAAAAHFVFDEYGVAAAGVLTHADYRRRGFGAAVVSAAVEWALQRGLVVEWCTTAKNLGSLGIVKRLGFALDSVDTELRVGADTPV
jgi:GNAT superfamily N-acetyltransferase